MSNCMATGHYGNSSQLDITAGIAVGGASAGTAIPGNSVPQSSGFTATVESTQPPPAAQSSEESSGKPNTSPLIDLNQYFPDGTESSLKQMLARLSQRLQLEIHIGFQDGETCRIVNSLPQTHRIEQVSARLRSAIDEAVVNISGFQAADSQRQTSMILKSLVNEMELAQSISFGIHGNSVRVGCLLLVKSGRGSISDEQLSSLVAVVRRELTRWLEVYYLCCLGTQSNRWSARWRKLIGNRRNWMLIAGGLLCSLALPIPYWPQRECIVEPASRRFLTSPVAGRVIDAQVRPGDQVKVDQLLARLDDESIRWELASAEAEYQKACKKHDTALSARSGGDLRLAQLEREQFAIQIESLQAKLKQLEIRSPISGIVVDGDWVRNTGTAVERSQTLFEIAPMDSMRIRTLLTTEDLGHAGDGTPVTLHVDSAPQESWSGQIERIDPRGRVEGSQVVFEAETVVENTTAALRPGMRGSVRISCGWRSLSWMIFHRPYTWLMKKLAW